MEYISQGHITGGSGRTREGVAGKVDVAKGFSEEIEHLLYDAQTSGGLLLCVAPKNADALASALESDDFLAARIGRIEAGAGLRIEA